MEQKKPGWFARLFGRSKARGEAPAAGPAAGPEPRGPVDQGQKPVVRLGAESAPPVGPEPVQNPAQELPGSGDKVPDRPVPVPAGAGSRQDARRPPAAVVSKAVPE